MNSQSKAVNSLCILSLSWDSLTHVSSPIYRSPSGLIFPPFGLLSAASILSISPLDAMFGTIWPCCDLLLIRAAPMLLKLMLTAIFNSLWFCPQPLLMDGPCKHRQPQTVSAIWKCHKPSLGAAVLRIWSDQYSSHTWHAWSPAMEQIPPRGIQIWGLSQSPVLILLSFGPVPIIHGPAEKDGGAPLKGNSQSLPTNEIFSLGDLL